MIGTLLIFLTCAQAPAAQPSDADVLRRLVQEHYAAQTRVNADDVFRVDVRRVEIDGARAHVRALVERTRTGPDRTGVVRAQRTSAFLLETWSRDGESWKLDAEQPLADAIADALLAAPPDRWPAMLAAEDPVIVVGMLRSAVGTRASTAAFRQQYAQAIPPFALLREIGRFAKAPRIEMEALQNLGSANYFLRRYPEAADAYGQELALARDAGDDDYEASALDGRAMVAYSRGDYTGALDGYSAALDIAERKREPAAIGRALVSVGNVQYLQGDYDLAASSYRRAIGLLSTQDRQTTAMAWRGAARVYVAHGDLAAALVSANHALDDARARQSQSEVANDQESIGEIHFRLGNAGEARKAFDEARRFFDAAKDSDSAGRLSGDLGLTELMAERFDAAVAAYTQGRTRYQQARNPVGIAHSWVGIGFSEAGRGRFDDAIDAYKVAIGLFQVNHRREDEGRAWLGLSLAHYGAADYASALDDAAHVSAIAVEIRSADLTWRAGVRAGDALRRLDRLDEAEREYSGAVGVIETIVPDAATSSDARTALEDSASAWAGLAFTRAARGDADGALLAAEQRRSHILRVMLAPFARDITRGMTPEETSAERASLRAIASLNAQVHAERVAPKPDVDRMKRIVHELTAAQADRRRTEDAVYARLPDLKLWRGLVPVYALDALDAALDGGALAVEYVAEDDQLLVITASRHGRTTDDGLRTTDVAASIVSWTRHSFARTLSDALTPTVLSDAGEWRRRTTALSELLMTAVTPRLAGVSHVIVVPDDVLWDVPFEALPLGHSDLGTVASVTYTSSLRALALRRAPSKSRGAAFIAAPLLAAATVSQVAAADPRWTPQDADAVHDQVRAEATPYGADARIVFNERATPAAADDALALGSLTEIDARVQISGAAPMFSGALLAPVSEDTDGRWEARKWFNARARGAPLILADASGSGPGLAAAMTAIDWATAAAGTSAVLTVRTPKGGFEVASLLRDLHASRAAGAEVGEALAAAVTPARTAGGAPARWAGLRILGRIR
jgi:tetratricopeptide (TPR) repeat protein